MSLVTTVLNNEYAKALRDLAMIIFREDVDVKVSYMGDKTQYDLYVDGQYVIFDHHDMKRFRHEAQKLKGIETYIGNFKKINVLEPIPGLKKHPNYPIWWSTSKINIPVIQEEFTHRSGFEVDNPQLSSNSFICRTQIVICMILCNQHLDHIRQTGFHHATVPIKISCVPSEEEIHLIECKDYQHAVSCRQYLSSNGVGSMIHPSYCRPVIAYISLNPVSIPRCQNPRNLKKRYSDLSHHEVGIQRYEEDDGLKAIHEDFIDEQNNI